MVQHFGKVAWQDVARKRISLPDSCAKSVVLPTWVPDTCAMGPDIWVRTLNLEPRYLVPVVTLSNSDIWYLPYRAKDTGIPVFCFWYTVYTSNTVNTIGIEHWNCPDCSLECIEITVREWWFIVTRKMRKCGIEFLRRNDAKLKTITTVAQSIVNSWFASLVISHK